MVGIKKIRTALFAVIMISLLLVVFSIPVMASTIVEEPLTLRVDGEELSSVTYAIRVDGCYMLPMGSLAERLGISVNWDSKKQSMTLEGKSRKGHGADVSMTIRANDINASFAKKSYTRYDGYVTTAESSEFSLRGTPTMYKGTLMVEPYDVLRAFDYFFDWGFQTIDIESGEINFDKLKPDIFGSPFIWTKPDGERYILSADPSKDVVQYALYYSDKPFDLETDYIRAINIYDNGKASFTCSPILISREWWSDEPMPNRIAYYGYKGVLLMVYDIEAFPVSEPTEKYPYGGIVKFQVPEDRVLNPTGYHLVNKHDGTYSTMLITPFYKVEGNTVTIMGVPYSDDGNYDIFEDGTGTIIYYDVPVIK